MLKPILLTFCFSAAFHSADAASVFWSFQTSAAGGSYSGPTTANPGAGSYTSNSGFLGTPSLQAIAGNSTVVVSGFAGGVDFADPNTGTTWVGGGTSAPGYTLNWGAGSTTSTSLAGAGMILGLNTTGLSGLSVSFDVRSATSGSGGSQGAPTGFSSISYRTDGGAWIPLATSGPTWSLSTSWQSRKELDLSSFEQLSNQANLELMLIFNAGAKSAETGITHNMRIDNLLVTAVPEASSMALAAAGALGLAIRRRRGR